MTHDTNDLTTCIFSSACNFSMPLIKGSTRISHVVFHSKLLQNRNLHLRSFHRRSDMHSAKYVNTCNVLVLRVLKSPSILYNFVCKSVKIFFSHLMIM